MKLKKHIIMDLTGYVEMSVEDAKTLQHKHKVIIPMSKIRDYIWEELSIADTIAIQATSGYGLFCSSKEEYDSLFNHMIGLYKGGFLGELSALEHIVAEMATSDGEVAYPIKTMFNGQAQWVLKK